MLLLADAIPPVADSFWPWLRNLAVFFAGIYYVGKGWRTFFPRPNEGTAMISPQPFIVKMAETFVRKEELDRVEASLSADMTTLEQKVDKLEERISEGQTEIINKGEARAVLVHKRIDNFQQLTADKFEFINRHIGEVMGELKRINR